MRAITWEQLDRFLARQCDEADRLAVEGRLTDWPHLRVQTGLLLTSLAPTPAPGRTETWVKLIRRLTITRPIGLDPNLPRRTWMKVAAAVAIAIGGAALTLWTLGAHRAVRDRSEWRVWATPSGQRASFRLPDGTKVILSVASTLRHPAAFTTTTREVALEGEAYFEVAPDRRRPFVVRAGNVVVEDIGTQFGLRAYPDDPSPSVMVRAGRVGLRPASAPSHAARHVLMPGQLGRLDPEGRPVVTQADTSMGFAWTHGWLVFDGIPLRRALPQLRRWFDLEFTLDDSTLGDIPVTAVLREQPTDEMLELLAGSLGMHQVRRGREVTLSRRTKGSS